MNARSRPSLRRPSPQQSALSNPTMTQLWRSVMTENTQIPAAQNVNENPSKRTEAHRNDLKGTKLDNSNRALNSR